ncbi:tRNA lysidine(34) synthetase TilS [bacterium]|nr:tRNA lysidine(34) synthetase TilS [bacterium]
MFIEKLKKTIMKYKMIEKKDKIIVGLSGGPDSVCLAHVLSEWKEKLHLKLYFAHFNHCLRGEESEKEVLWVKKFAQKLKIPLIIKKKNVFAFSKKNKLGKEEAARILRYNFFEELSKKKKANKIALGHNADDQAETILMWLIRGAGKAGFSGIPPKRLLSLNEKKPMIIRPLIEIKRKEIEAYLRKKSLYYCIDSSNLKPVYLRNKIRLELLPYLGKYNPRIREHLIHWAEIFREEELYLQGVTDKLIKEAVIKKKKGEILLDLKKILGYNTSLQRRIFLKVLKKKVNFENIELILDLIRKPVREKQIFLAEDLWIKKEKKTLIIGESKGFIRNKEFCCKLKVPGETKITSARCSLIVRIYPLKNNIPIFIGRKEKDFCLFDWDILRKKELWVRNRKEGDRFRPFGMQGTKKIKDFFIDEKIFSGEKDLIPLLVAEKEIIWVGGLRRADKAKITKKTKNIMEVKIKRWI